MIIDFDERKFRAEVLNMVRPLGLDKSLIGQVVSQALLAVRRASKPVKM
ncbi:hypothetical protein SPSIL_056060 [Sporomusa silvacetica DSM 10669]|uniref:Uncharacterized protein n=1 Tax=Sporomusa silvacetica DSM 10669 TaxID=1123289 RepID=A0ABZ3IVH7_9FIRM|nr:hypothetical protein [Sporomusa silvacetica]OZC13009.1 hypothetical protein SPSIL_57290 [Sporomusa silvacetica DSM 10669]